MTDEELDQFEAKCGVTLPSRYRSILLNYPQALLDMADVYPMKKGPPQRVGPENAELYNDIDLIQLANLGDPDYKNEIFPSHFFIIGDSGCGDYYAIDTADEAAPVYMGGCHPNEYGEDECEPVSASIEQWVERLVTKNAP